MKFKIKVYLQEFNDRIKRDINVNDSVLLNDFCNCIITSMNGNCKGSYELIKDNKKVFEKDKIGVTSCDDSKGQNLGLESLGLKEGDILKLKYNSKTEWIFEIVIEEIQNGTFDKDFEVITGAGNGIMEDISNKDFLRRYLNLQMEEQTKKFYGIIYDEIKKYMNSEFDVIDINTKIKKIIA